MVEIIHFSDLHLGCGDFRKEYLENVINYIDDVNPDIVICTGDIVHKGRLNQYEAIVPYLNRIKEKHAFLIVPGNHDVKNSGIIRFERAIGPRRTKKILEEKDTLVVGLCSAKDDVSTGEIGDEQLEWVASQFNQYTDSEGNNTRYENRIIALHHHVIGVPYNGRKATTLTDAGEIIELTQLMNIDLVLMGHKHIPHAYIIEGQNDRGTAFIYCGTSSSIKVRADEAPSFNHIFLEKGSLTVNIVNSDMLEETVLLSRKEGHTKFVRPRQARIEHLLKVKQFDELH